MNRSFPPRRSSITCGLAGRRTIDPGLAAVALLHHRESEIIGLVARRPHELGRPECGDILAEIIAHAFPLPDQADLVPLLEVRRAPQLHAAVGLAVAIAAERHDAIILAAAPARDRRLPNRHAGSHPPPPGARASSGNNRRPLPPTRDPGAIPPLHTDLSPQPHHPV